MRSRSGVVPSGPCHYSHKTLGSRRRSPRGNLSTSTRMSVPTTMGKGPRLPRPSWFWTFGCSSAQARMRTNPYFADTHDAIGPLGAKGMGECPVNPVAPALANALADATGVRFRDLPFTPDRIYRRIFERHAV